MADLIDLLIPLAILIHLLVAPHTKVEESFAMQATHDILVYGTPPPVSFTGGNEHVAAAYDHFAFPGAVPRSFVGPLLLAGLSQGPVAWLAGGFRHAQLVVRLVLGVVWNGGCLVAFARALRGSLGRETAAWWVLLVAGQFHVAFYASRTLMNMFAFGLTTLAFASLLPKRTRPATRAHRRLAIAYLVVAAVIFRAELALLLMTTVLYLVIVTRRPVLIARLIFRPFVLSFLAALVVSVPLDSYFWQRPVWPELSAFAFNAWNGHASDWGEEPPHWYFSNALPRLFMFNPLVPILAFSGLVLPETRRRVAGLTVPSLLFVALYSLQPHKETRFVIYVVPPLTAAAALAAQAILVRLRRGSPAHDNHHHPSAPSKSPAPRWGPFFAVILTALLSVSILVSLAASAAMLLVSSLNYPGGDALAVLQGEILPRDHRPRVTVHTDVLSCMTGVTLFGQNPHGLARGAEAAALSSLAADPNPASLPRPFVVWDKTEDDELLEDPTFWTGFDYLLVENPAEVVGGVWDVVGVVHGYAGIEVLQGKGAGEHTPLGRAAGEDAADEIEQPIVGKGKTVRWIKDTVRPLTGGWWVGPRIEPRIRIMKRRWIVEAV